MYFVAVTALMFVLPVLSILAEWAAGSDAGLLFLVGKWFVFWAAGIRLLLAGFKQVLQPSYTAKTIFGIDDPDAEKLVTEIGCGNLAIGLIGTLSLLVPGWVAPSGLAGGLYLALAGVKHGMNRHRSAKENFAMVTDFAGAAILAVGVIARLA